MQIYFSPELIKQDAQVMNVVTDQEQAVGYLAFLQEEKKMYVFGDLQEEGVCENYKDLIKPYIQGLTKINEGLEVYCFISVGGKKLELELKNEKKN